MWKIVKGKKHGEEGKRQIEGNDWVTGNETKKQRKLKKMKSE